MDEKKIIKRINVNETKIFLIIVVGLIIWFGTFIMMSIVSIRCNGQKVNETYFDVCTGQCGKLTHEYNWDCRKYCLDNYLKGDGYGEKQNKEVQKAKAGDLEKNEMSDM